MFARPGSLALLIYEEELHTYWFLGVMLQENLALQIISRALYLYKQFIKRRLQSALNVNLNNLETLY